MDDATVITRVELRNYKSIAACDVRLGPLTFIVGPNGSGKSNFLDALRFVSDAVRNSLESALWARGGVAQVRRRGERGVKSFRIAVEVRATPNVSAEYAIEVAPEKAGGFRILEERCVVTSTESGDVLDEFRVRNGVTAKTRRGADEPGTEQRAAAGSAAGDCAELWLPRAVGASESLRQVATALSAMAFFNIDSHRLKSPLANGHGEALLPDGGNLAAVFEELRKTDPTAVRIIVDYLRLFVPGIRDVRVARDNGLRTLEFEQRLGNGTTERFPAMAMSDGTLRALAVLVGLFHTSPVPEHTTRLVAIEEPELTVYPSEAGLLVDALRIASYDKQVIVTSHSADMLDDKEIEVDAIVTVGLDHGTTLIGPVDDIARGVLRDRLLTKGELLRLGQLVPDGKVLIHEEPSLSTGPN